MEQLHRVRGRSAGGEIWPIDLLDVDSLVADGWQPLPFREFVLKLHQRCNLACDYCYVYTMADQSWRDRPKIMSEAVRIAAVNAIAAHVDKHAVDSALVILHGGEPLLAGLDVLTEVAGALRRGLPPGCRLRLGLQTNGTLLDAAAISALAGAGITISVSIDGSAAGHDRRRSYAGGRASHAQAAAAVSLLGTEFRDSFGGLLAVVDVAQDPVECYEALLQFRPPAIDFLLPHANWMAPPAREVYGEWLVRVFDRWYDAPIREMRVRLFDELLNLLLGGRGGTDQLGLTPSLAVVVETDGAIEQSDALKSAYPGAAATPWNVLRHSFEDALYHPGFVARQIGPAALSEECMRCPVHRICGGGHYAHRYRESNGFRNPSVYSADLRFLIEHVHKRLSADLHPNGHP